MSEAIDFVITWVDGSEPEWLAQYQQYKKESTGNTHAARFRDWENLHYWFRGVESFAPWVRKIHFVTWGHLPDWLNTKHPKINIVKHNDFIPETYLPTFNSRTIELNFHRIKELSPHYVYFNDDIFLINTVKKEDFFRSGLPCDMPELDLITGAGIHSVRLTNINLINGHYQNLIGLISKSPLKWLNIKYGLKINLQTIRYAILANKITGFVDYHMAQPMLKSCLEELWEIEYHEMERSCLPYFRHNDSLNQYIQRYWALVSNRYSPYNVKALGKYFGLCSSTVQQAVQFITTQRKPLICLNDNESEDNFEAHKNIILSAFQKILPYKSQFEI